MADHFPEPDRLQWGGDSETKEERQGLQEDRHMQKVLDMFVTESSAGRMPSASCGTITGAGLGGIGRLGVQRRQAVLVIPLDTSHGIQREGTLVRILLGSLSTSALPCP